MARVIALVLGLLAVVYTATAQENPTDNQIFRTNSRRIENGDELVSAIVDDCFASDVEGQTSMSCLRLKVLSYLDSVLGEKRGKSLEEEESDAERLDDMILSRVTRYLKSHEFKVQLPEFLFQEAVLTFRPARGLADFKVEFPKTEEKDEDRSLSEARDMMKKKLLLPLMLLMKLKMKALAPIFLAIIGFKAMKALVLSKIAILLVVGFLVVQLCKKLGMPMPMAMPVESMPYGAPAPTPSAPASSYEPGWDAGANGGGPYSRVWDAQQMAYNAYYQQQQPQGQQQ